MTDTLRKFKNRLTSNHDALSALQKTPLHLDCSNSELLDIAKKMQRCDVKAGQILYDVGDYADYIAVVFKGELVVLMRGEAELSYSQDSQEMAELNLTEICDKTTGDLIIDGFRSEDKVRASRVVAKTAAAIFILGDKETQDIIRLFNREKAYKEAVCPLLLYLNNDLIEAVIRPLSLFADVMEHVPLIASMLHYRVVDKGEYIIREGGIGDTMYFVQRGSLDVVFGTGKSAITRDTLIKGKCFGETALLMQMPRTSNVIANEPCLLLELRISEFRRFLSISENLEMNLRIRMQDTIANHFRKYNVPFFNAIADDALWRMAQLSVIESYECGAVVFSIGDLADRFFMIIHGEVQVAVDNIVKVLGQGSFFGEVALMTGAPRTATVTTLSKCVFLTLERSAFLNMFKGQDSQEKQAASVLRGQFISPRSFTLTDMLYNPKACVFLSKFAEEIKCAENVLFWLAVEKFRSAAVTKDDDYVSMARSILVTYLTRGAQREIMISIAAFNAIRAKARDRDTIDENLFHSAQNPVFLTMQQDLFPLFKKAPIYQEFIRTMEANKYEDLEIESTDIQRPSFSESTRSNSQTMHYDDHLNRVIGCASVPANIH